MNADPHDARTALIACLPRLRRYARALTGNRSEADDLVQDTMERGWRKLSMWRYGSDMRAWLFGIMHNLHVDRFRGNAPPMDAFDDDTPQAVDAATPGQGLVLRDLESCLRRLSDEQREVLLLVALEELSYEETAAALGIPLGTVMSRLSRARERLRVLMEGGPDRERAGTPSLKVIK